MLYTIAKSPFNCDFPVLLRLITNQDAVLLIQDGVIVAIDQSKYLNELQNTGVQIYALEADIIARGLQNKISEAVSLVTYQGFVRLTEAHKQHFSL
ncbi:MULTISPECIES: sulfurtransferase complex subunit TusB [Providencia]|uniref:sulfurtransferase complex subunit TusB n=1 Tax=Providencia TaxID=586 RepID=UPI0008395D8C|nr:MULTISPECIES: sulfurtransferase complex subunit TusB [Providencia]MBP6121515.1 sulfurtransferase complex subunit TusB [Providencia sp.]MDD9339802.1 sulfurtransferase complex subunit TusB [Providencia heimbachae]NIH21082.1 sulfurtransferase complex subunit TusB [Providencia heimbachae]QCJ68700.1 sulfurtransferase complex subunit TusB [Providencia heimbachae]